jgi:hypothetical protein
MKILAGELESSAGNASIEANARVGQLSQDQFAYDEYRVLDVMMMGYEKFWGVSVIAVLVFVLSLPDLGPAPRGFDKDTCLDGGTNCRAPRVNSLSDFQAVV